MNDTVWDFKSPQKPAPKPEAEADLKATGDALLRPCLLPLDYRQNVAPQRKTPNQRCHFADIVEGFPLRSNRLGIFKPHNLHVVRIYRGNRSLQTGVDAYDYSVQIDFTS